MKSLLNLPKHPRHWLIPKEALFSYNLLSSFDDSEKSFIEVGVLTGAWSLNLLRNFDVIKGYGIDPYPNLNSIKSQLLDDVSQYNFHLYSSFLELPSISNLISMIHIDGLHTEEAVLSDINFSLPLLRDNGILIVDDYLHPYFPGIASALYKSIETHNLSPFLHTGSKSYLCRKKYYNYYYLAVEAMLSAQSEIPWCRHWGEGASNAYVSTPAINGFTPILSLEFYKIKPTNVILPNWPSQPDFSKPQSPC